MINKKFRHLDLFSGIGGFALAASWIWGQGHEIVSFCEIEPFPKKVLKKHWPDVPIHDDIKTMKGDQYGRIDLLIGGFPCQPYSTAGKRRGKDDDRALWPEMFRIIKEAKPNWVIGENVAGFINMGLDEVLFDMGSQGYETTTFAIPACGISADQKRERVWMVSNTMRRFKEMEWEIRGNWWEYEQIQGNKICQRESEPRMVGVADGVSSRVDRLKGLGNAIVPQTVAPIMQAIKQINSLT